MTQRAEKAQEFLMLSRELRSTLDAELDAYQRMSTLRTKVTTRLNCVGVVSGGGSDIHAGEDLHCEIDSKRQEIEALTLEILRHEEDVFNVLGTMDNLQQRRIIRHRYLEDKLQKEIAVELGYSSAYLRRVHQKALECFGEGLERRAKAGEINTKWEKVMAGVQPSCT